MTKREIQEVIARVLRISVHSVAVGNDSTHVTANSVSANYDQLAELAAALGTTKIDFDYYGGEPGYSSWTPGTNGSFSFTIGIGAAA